MLYVSQRISNAEAGIAPTLHFIPIPARQQRTTLNVRCAGISCICK
jgi:hypothetical protein